MTISRPLLCTAAAAVALTACDGNRGGTTAGVTPGVPITAANALDVARAAWRTAFDPVRVAHIAARLLDEPLPEPSEPPAPPQRVVTREFPGAEGGGAVLTWEDEDLDGGYSSGDAFTIVFADYGTGGRVLTGAMAFTDVTVDGTMPDGMAWSCTADLAIAGLRLEYAGATTTIDGDFRCHRERRATVDLLRLELTSDVQVGAGTLHRGARLTRDDFIQTFSSAWIADGELTEATLGGLVVRTEVPLTGIQVMPDPQTGEFVVLGGNGSTVAIVPVDLFNVELQVDENGDGEIDATVPAEWTAF